MLKQIPEATESDVGPVGTAAEEGEPARARARVPG
jgi:hypothetical protein